MKKIKLIAIITLIIFMITGCSSSKEETKLQVPKNSSEWLELYPDFKITLFTMAEGFVERYEGVEVNARMGYEVKAVDTPVKNKDGETYKYSFFISGEYVNKATSVIDEYIVQLGIKEDQFDIEEGKRTYTCLRYASDKAGTYYDDVEE